MKADAVVEFLKCLGVSRIRLKDGWIHAPCPLAPWTHTKGTDANPSFAIKINDNGSSYFNCFSCERGKLEKLIGLMMNFGADKPKYQLRLAQDILIKDAATVQIDIKPFSEDEDAFHFTPFDEGWLQTFAPASDYYDATDYLTSRNVHPDTAKELDIRWDQNKHTVCFPIYGFDKKCYGLHGRYVNPPTPKLRYHSYEWDGHRNQPVWYGEWFLDEYKPVVMVESVFDLAAVVPLYKNVIAPLSASINAAKIARIKYHVSDIVTLFDYGKAGDKARDTISKAFGGQVKKHILLTEDQKDPGELPTHILAKLLDDSL